MPRPTLPRRSRSSRSRSPRSPASRSDSPRNASRLRFLLVGVDRDEIASFKTNNPDVTVLTMGSPEYDHNLKIGLQGHTTNLNLLTELPPLQKFDLIYVENMHIAKLVSGGRPGNRPLDTWAATYIMYFQNIFEHLLKNGGVLLLRNAGGYGTYVAVYRDNRYFTWMYRGMGEFPRICGRLYYDSHGLERRVYPGRCGVTTPATRTQKMSRAL